MMEPERAAALKSMWLFKANTLKGVIAFGIFIFFIGVFNGDAFGMVLGPSMCALNIFYYRALEYHKDGETNEEP